MAVTVFLSGRLLSDGQMSINLSSSAVLFMIEYCAPVELSITFVEDADDIVNWITLPVQKLENSSGFSVIQLESLPLIVRNCQLPVIWDKKAMMVRSGLCCAVRHIVKMANETSPTEGFKDVLGFRQGSLRMCAEVSGWTKLCEVELNASLTELISTLRSTASKDKLETIQLPADLMKLELHFQTEPKLHNDDKLRRAVLKELHEDLESVQGRNNVLKHCRIDKTSFVLDREMSYPHGNRHFVLLTNVGNKIVNINQTNVETSVCGRQKLNGEEMSSKGDNLPECKGTNSIDDLIMGIENMTYKDVQMVHLYSEGVEMTIADLILFVYMYHLLDSLNFNSFNLEENIPLIMKWLKNMVNIATVKKMAESSSYSIRKIEECVNSGRVSKSTTILTSNHTSMLNRIPDSQQISEADTSSISNHTSMSERIPDSQQISEADTISTTNQTSTSHHISEFKRTSTKEHASFTFILPSTEDKIDDNDDDLELSRRCKTKHKAYKPDVSSTLKKVKSVGIIPQTSEHPCGSNVQLPWEQFPSSVHPREGNVPEKRTARKCQQLENLVTAVQNMAQPGHIIVDFCSGGGHLGIVIAYLLPECKVYLIENKEESLMKAKHRVDVLKLKNIVLYQCNLDYFHGTFDIGLCLHACGSATDMVLQQCLRNSAAFVICPCCYGSIQKTHLLSYPRSKRFLKANISYKDFLTLGHAADQTEFKIALEEQGRYCSNLVDTDRAELARESGYQVTLCSLHPRTCTPKNNLLIGFPQNGHV